MVLPGGQRSIAWLSVGALLAIVIMTRVGAWYKAHHRAGMKSNKRVRDHHPDLTSRKIAVSLAVLVALVFY